MKTGIIVHYVAANGVFPALVTRVYLESGEEGHINHQRGSDNVDLVVFGDGAPASIIHLVPPGTSIGCFFEDAPAPAPVASKAKKSKKFKPQKREEKPSEPKQTEAQ